MEKAILGLASTSREQENGKCLLMTLKNVFPNCEQMIVREKQTTEGTTAPSLNVGIEMAVLHPLQRASPRFCNAFAY